MADIDLNINADLSKTLQAIEEFGKTSSKSLIAIENEFTTLNKSAATFGEAATKNSNLFSSALKGVGIAAAGALAFFTGRAVVNFFEDAIAAASEQEQATQKLNTALALSGSYSKQASQDIQDFASSLQATTGFSDDQTLSLVALAKSFGVSNEKAKEIVKTSIDLQAATGEDAKGAVEALSKGLLGFKSSLERTRPEISGLTEDQKKAGEQIKILQDKFGATAQALTQNFSGALKLVKVNFGEVLETIGQGIIENTYVVASLNKVSEAFIEFNKYLSKNKKEVIDFTTKGVVYLIDLIPVLIEGIGGLVNAFRGIQDIIPGLKFALAVLGDFAIDVADSFVNAFVKIPAYAFKPVIEGVLLTTKALNAVGAVSDDSLKSITAVAQEIDNLALNGVETFSGLRSSIQEFGAGAINSLDNTSKQVAKTDETIAKIAQGAKAFGSSIKDMAYEVSKSADELDKLNKKGGKTSKDFEDQAKALDEIAKSFEGLQKELQKAEDQRNPIKGFEREQAERLKILQTALDNGLVAETEAARLRQQIGIDASTAIAKETEKLNKESLEAQKKSQQEYIASIKSATAEGLASPLITSSQAKSATGLGDQGAFSPAVSGGIAQIAGVLSGALEGAAGATKLISAGFGAIADTIVPGIGGAVSQIVGILAQGPEKVKAQIEEFAKAIPEVLKAIQLAIPVVIQTLADNADEIIIAIVKDSPKISAAIIKQIPNIVQSLVLELPKELIKALLEEIQNTFKLDNLKQGFSDLGDGVGRAGRDFSANVKDGANKAGLDISNYGKTFGGQVSEVVKGLGLFLSDTGKALFEGLRGFIVSIGQMLATFGEGLGSVATQIYDGLKNLLTNVAQGAVNFGAKIGEGAAAFFSGVKDFFAGLGNILGNIGTSIYTGIKNAITSLTQGFSSFGGSIAEGAKNFGTKILEGASNFGKKIGEGATNFYNGLKDFFKGLGNILGTIGEKIKDGLKAFVDGIGTAFSKIFETIKTAFKDLFNIGGSSGGGGGIGSTISNAFKSVGSALGFAEGGMVPGGFPNDTFPARLTSGENIIDRSLNQKLENYLNNQGSGGGKDPVRIILQVGEKQLADVLLNINRQGFRT